jgi:hypothetical protein
VFRRTELMRTPHDNPPEWMFVLTAYIDESGYGAKDIIVLGGFVGNDEQWDLCTGEWKRALGKRRALHMKTLRWKNVDRLKPQLQKLGAVPHNCGLIPIWMRLRVSDYADLMEQTTVARKIHHGYFLGAQFLALIALGYAQASNERIKIVFEYNEHFAPILPAAINLYGHAFSFFMKDMTRCMAGVEMVAKNSSSLTQPADYLAYARLQELRDPGSVRARLCSPILEPQLGVHVDVTRQTVRNLMSSPTQRKIRELGRELEPYVQAALRLKREK